MDYPEGVGREDEEEEEEEEEEYLLDDEDADSLEDNEEIRRFLSDLEEADRKKSAENSSGSSNTNNDDSCQMSFNTKCVCGGITALILAAIYMWNDTLGLDLITMVLSLVSIVYVWTNG